MLKVLLVEDNRHLALALETRLKSMGYNLITADNVASAMSMIVSRKPDVSLIDINLPDGTGFTIDKQIMNNPNTPTIPMVFISADGSTEHKELAKFYSCTPLLEKPFKASQLIDVLAYAQHSSAEKNVCPFAVR